MVISQMRLQLATRGPIDTSTHTCTHANSSLSFLGWEQEDEDAEDLKRSSKKFPSPTISARAFKKKNSINRIQTRNDRRYYIQDF